MPGRRQLGASVIAGLLIFVASAIELTPPASASGQSTATAPQQLVHAFPLGPQRLSAGAESNRTTISARSARGGATAGGRRSDAADPSASSNTILIVVLGGVALLLVLGGAHATYGARRRRTAAALTAGIGPARGAAPRTVKPAANGTRGSAERVWEGRQERAYRQADHAGDPAGAFNLGVLLHQRGELAGARSAYERAERSGDPDAAFNLGVLLYETGDLDGAEAAWRRCAARGHHPRAAANLRFVMQRRGARGEAAEAGAPEPEESVYRRADQARDPAGAFNLGVLLHQRGELAGARSAYERAERSGDPDAAFNLGVLLYEFADLDGAEAAWRRSVASGHPRAAENLRFLLQCRRGTRPREGARVGGAAGPGGTTNPAGRR